MLMWRRLCTALKHLLMSRASFRLRLLVLFSKLFGSTRIVSGVCSTRRAKAINARGQRLGSPYETSTTSGSLLFEGRAGTRSECFKEPRHS
ncbi:hypothetical protein R1flu_012269 [Riccia fluitans]|uniref:Secreted protein n=1 Tax=Riccia fluitans TaxID=41844 RepID=A0ABD1ZA57_9MARC